MKKLIAVLFLMLLSGIASARDIGQPAALVGEDKGGWAYCGKFYVGVSTINPFMDFNMDNVMDYLIRPAGKIWYSYDQKVSTYAVVNSTGGWTGESNTLESGDSLSSKGRVGDFIFFKALAPGSTVQIDIYSRRKYR